jgi:hypothetical protein
MFVFFRFVVLFLLSFGIIFASEDEEIKLLDISRTPSSYGGLGKTIFPTGDKLGTESVSSILLVEDTEHVDLSLGLLPSMTSEKDLINWLDTEVVNRKDPLSQCTNRSLFVFGTSSAIARGSVYFILGYKLSENYLVKSIESPGNYILSVIYASAASVPMTILGAASSQKFLKYLITPTPQNFINIKKEESCFQKSLKISSNGALIIASACSASILTYIAYDNFYPLIGWGWLAPGLPTFYVRTLIDFYAMGQLGSAAYEKFISGPRNKKLYETQPDSRGADIHEIRELLEESRNFVSSLHFKQAKILEDIVSSVEEDVDQKVKAFTNPAFFVRDDVNIIRSSCLREAAGYLGGAVAVCGMYLYYNGTKAAFGFTQPLFNLTAEETHYTTASFAIFSLATASSLSAIAAHSSVQKFYDVVSGTLTGSYKWISSLCRNSKNEDTHTPPSQRTSKDTELMMKRAGVASLAFLLASCDAGTLYELAMQQNLSMNDFANVLALVSSSVALFSMSFWAVDEGLMYYVRGGDPKTAVLSLIDQVDETLSSMSDRSLKALKQILRINHEVVDDAQ